MTNLEKELETFAVAYAGNLGLKAVKLHCDQLNGWPDRTVIGPGGAVGFIEFKTATGKPSRAQSYWLKTLQGLGHRAAIVRTKTQAKDFLESLAGTKPRYLSTSTGVL